jgi:hypothetical protein
VVRNFSLLQKVQTGTGANQPPNELFLPGGTTQGAPRLKMNGVILLLPLYVFMAWTEITLFMDLTTNGDYFLSRH